MNSCDRGILRDLARQYADHRCSGWGIAGERKFSDEPGGAFKMDYPIRDLADIERLRFPRHEIDEGRTAERVGRLSEAVGDILTVNLDRGPAYRMWTGDISTELGCGAPSTS